MSYFKLPSRPWLAFYATTASIAAAAYYDRRGKQTERALLDEAAAPHRLAPLAPTAMPPRVVVCLAPAPGNTLSTTRWFFGEYVKPVLNAAGVDFGVIEGKSDAELQQAVHDHVWLGKRNHLRAVAAERYVEALQQRSGLWQWLTAAFRAPLPPLATFYPSAELAVPDESDHEMVARLAVELRDGKFASNEAVLALGPGAFAAAVRGIESAALASPAEPSAEGPVAAGAEYFDATFALPPVAELPLDAPAGWRSLPLRVYRWFNQRETVRAVGRATLGAALGESVRPLDDPSVDPVVCERMTIIGLHPAPRVG